MAQPPALLVGGAQKGSSCFLLVPLAGQGAQAALALLLCPEWVHCRSNKTARLHCRLHNLTHAAGGGSEPMGVPGDEDVMGLIVSNASNEEIPLGASISAGDMGEMGKRQG